MSTIESLLSEATDGFKRQMRAVYEAGRDAGRKEYAAEVRSKLAAIDLLGDAYPAPVDVIRQDALVEEFFDDRAARGSVKPAVLDYVRQNSQGLTANEIAERTSIKYNSVRGALWKLSNESEVHKRGEKWFPGPKKNEAPAGKAVSASTVTGEVDASPTDNREVDDLLG